MWTRSLISCEPGAAERPIRRASQHRRAKRRRRSRHACALVPELTDRGGELATEVHVLIVPAALLARPAASAHVGVGETLLRGLFDRRCFRQNPLPLIAIASCAPAHYDPRQSAGLRGAPSQRGVTRRQKLEVAEVGAVQTQCTRLVHGGSRRCRRTMHVHVLWGEITMIRWGRRGGRSSANSGMSVDAQWVR